MNTSSVSLSGKEFRQLYQSFRTYILEKYKSEAVDFIKRHIENARKAVDYNVERTDEYNRSFMVTSGLVSARQNIDVKAEKARITAEALDRFTKSKNQNEPIEDLILSMCHTHAQRDLYRNFDDCDFSDEAVVTLTLEQYRELNIRRNS